MDRLPFFIVDVFAETKYSGNQLTVFLDANTIESDQMQSIASEMHFSETTFVPTRELREGGYDVRIFTPNEEVTFAGHPTLGTAYIINRELENGLANHITLNLPVGTIPVDFDRRDNKIQCVWMTQAPPCFGKDFTAAEIAPVINLTEDEIDRRFPIQIVSTGLPFILIPVTSLKALKRAQVNREQYFALIANIDAKPCISFA